MNSHSSRQIVSQLYREYLLLQKGGVVLLISDMNKAIVYIVFAFCSCAWGQSEQPTCTMPIVNNDFVVTGIDTLSEKQLKDQLYSLAKTWVVNNFVDSKEVIQLDDKENGQIIAKGLFQYSHWRFLGSEGYKGHFRFSLSIQVKDGRYRYSFYDIYHESTYYKPTTGCSFGRWTDPPALKYKMYIADRNGAFCIALDKIKKLETSLKEHMKTTAKKENDW